MHSFDVGVGETLALNCGSKIVLLESASFGNMSDTCKPIEALKVIQAHGKCDLKNKCEVLVKDEFFGTNTCNNSRLRGQFECLSK